MRARRIAGGTIRVVRPILHHRIGQTLSNKSRKILGSENFDYLTQNAHARPFPKGSQSGRTYVRWSSTYF
ncbi:MAG TPA: hypothetical protein VFY46_05835, partial [Acidimicrobiia bacterium]|nr:hypothetical protein [Acidimicrobiia bacterium]